MGFVTICAALFLRLNGLSDYYYNSDEMWHLVVANQKTIPELIEYNFRQEVHPPLSPIIWHFMLKISDNPLWIRSASYIPSILTIPSVYYLGRLFIGHAAGFAMAMIVAFSIFSISIGNSVRAYPMMLLALVWAGIFVYKYITTYRQKYLWWYFALAFIAIELVHSSAFILLIYGLILMWNTFKRKAKFAFVLISFGHIVLASCVVGYIYLVNMYHALEFNYTYFVIAGDTISYAWNAFCRIIIFMYNMVAEDDNAAAFVVSTFLLLFLPFYLIKDKRLDLLHIIFSPLIILVALDYLKIYPLSHTQRNNLFLFLPFLFLFGVFAQKIYDYIVISLENITKLNGRRVGDLLRNKLIDIPQCIYLCTLGRIHNKIYGPNRLAAKLLILISIPCIWAFSDFKSGSFKSSKVTSSDYYMTVSNFRQHVDYIDKYNNDRDVMIVEHQIIWYFIFLEGSKGKVEYITKNLGHFKSPNYEFYFPHEEAFLSLYHFKIFLEDLFKELKEKGRYNDVENIVYLGGDESLLGGILTPRFVDERKYTATNIGWYEESFQEFEKQRKELSWVALGSEDIKIKISEKDSNSNLYIAVLGMTPKFINNNILNRDFVDIMTMKKKAFYGK